MALPMIGIGPQDATNATDAHVPASDAAREAVLGTYKRSLELIRGEGVYLIDADGNRYLDFVSGIAVNALGYSDAGLVAAMRRATTAFPDPPAILLPRKTILVRSASAV